jgi:DSF synthase
MTNVSLFPSISGADCPTFKTIATHIDGTSHIAWCYMTAQPRQCFTAELLQDLNNWCEYMKANADRSNVRYHVIASAAPGIFNLGGDLDLFRRLAEHGDRDLLLDYAIRCIDAIHANLVSFQSSVTTISLVQGEALGGGFETVLSSDVVIAEKRSRMGFPEILFNLFPGMGAYSILSRKLDGKHAEQMILSGKLYSAEELYDMGLVDVLAEDGEGESAVLDYIKRENRARNGFRAFRQARNSTNPISYEELKKSVEIWVDAAMRLEKRDLKMMERLASRQHKAMTHAA